jgi:hypothetical protein
MLNYMVDDRSTTKGVFCQAQQNQQLRLTLHKINRNCPSISEQEDCVSKTQQILPKFLTTLSPTDPADLFDLHSNIFFKIRVYTVQDFRNLQVTVAPTRFEILDLY